MGGASPPQALLPAPSLRRRLACFIYEGVLLFGVVMTAGFLYSVLTQQRHALSGLHGMQMVVFAVLALYFGWFWSHGGQTVAMKTWHIRLLDRAGRPVAAWRALVRYLLSWLWFLPALALTQAAGWNSGGAVAAALTIGVLAYAALSLLLPQRQYLHDRLSGTQLVFLKPKPPQRSTTR